MVRKAHKDPRLDSRTVHIAMGDGISDIDIGDLCKLYLGLTSMAGLG